MRSQMAAAFLNAYFGDRYEAYSAGIESSETNPRLMKVMKEIGMDISSSCAKSIKELSGCKFDCIITLCDYAKTFCSSFPPHRKYLHKSFKDYCRSNFCEAAGKSDVCFPRDSQRRAPGVQVPFDSELTENEIICAFRDLREEIFEWVEKEMVF